MTTRRDVAVVGAGLAGLAAASTLTEADFTVTVFEKSRGPGGRLSTRRSRDGFEFDHGTQTLSAGDDGFGAYLGRALERGHAARWVPAPAAGPKFVGIPGMRELVAPLARGLDIVLETRVTALAPDAGGIEVVIGDGGSGGRFDAVLVTAPAPQTAALLAPFGATNALDDVAMAPCWTVMLGFDAELDTHFDAEGDALPSPLAWLARNTAKPERPAEPECWVVQADAAYSSARLEADPDAVAADLSARALSVLGVPSRRVVHTAAHLWRYALTTRALGAPCLAVAGAPVWAAGDWCLGARASDAYASGLAVATTMAEALARD